ncbi:hypothetical protein [Ureibacillus thermosphaericus]|uniref:hypothetical protein n=1 Tax=Ureibacillus thermosphaericus TaxID=51173 RepID=UPI000BBB88A0|nr:hypothetical protein [Ureibacillus thermosphaericus]
MKITNEFGGVFIFAKILANIFGNSTAKNNNLKQNEQQQKSSKLKNNPLYMFKKVFVPDEIQVSSRQQHIKKLQLEDNIRLTPNPSNSCIMITDQNGNDLGILLPSKANEVKQQFEKECTEYDANVIELDWKDGYYHYSFVVMSGMLKDQSNRFSYDDDHDWDDMDPSSDWDEYDEDGTHYTDFPEKYGYDRDYFS